MGLPGIETAAATPGQQAQSPPSTAELLARRLLHGLARLAREQHPNGEILSYGRDPEGNYHYARSPFVSTFVHDALGYFDPSSPLWEPAAVHTLSGPARGWFLRQVIAVRQRIRRYLAWQQEPDGRWRFFGRGSGIDPDANTTACAALVLLEHPRRNRQGPWHGDPAAVLGFQAAEGLFYTFNRPGRGGYGWLDASGRTVVGFDRVVQAEVLRYLCRVGLGRSAAAAHLIAWLRQEATSADWQQGTALYPNPVTFFYATARAWRQGRLPGRTSLAADLGPRLLARQGAGGDFGGPLSTALAVVALHDLDYHGPEVEQARLAILRQARPGGGWPYEDFVVGGFGSAAWTTAAAMLALARCHARQAEDGE